MYPLHVIFNEIFPSLRRKYILTPFLFLKNKEKEISFNQIYLSVFVDECKELYASGLNWTSSLLGQQCCSRIIPYSLNWDSVMKPDLIGIRGHAGYSSCPACTIRRVIVYLKEMDSRCAKYPSWIMTTILFIQLFGVTKI